MKNHKVQNVLKAVFILPIVLVMVFPWFYLYNDLTLKETWDDMFKDFWRRK